MESSAFGLATLGFKIFPIAARKKAPPLWNDWPNRAASDSAPWATEYDLNIGIHCEGLLVVDVDPAKGGLASWLALRRELGLPATRVHGTPSGGFHIIYRLPEGHPGVANSVERLGKGLDVRSTGGYIVAPGSRTAKGEYTVVDDRTIAEAPADLVGRAGRVEPKAPPKDVPDTTPDAVAAAVAWLAGHPEAVEGAGGDLHTYQTACRLRDLGLSADQAFEAMAGEWNARCAPPWPFDELQTKVRNAYIYAQNEEGGTLRVATADMFPCIEAPAPAAGAPIPSMAEVLKRRAARRPYLVKGVLLQATHAQLFGAPGEGKTFVALDLAHAIATGREWHGKKVAKGPVVYVAYEGLGGLPDRLKALEQRYGLAADLHIADGGKYDMCSREGRAALGADIKATCQPLLVIFDTFARALALSGGDENSAKDVGLFNQAVAGLIETFGTSVMVIHHTGHNNTDRARGSSAVFGALDTEIKVAAFAVEATKQRDLQEGPVFAFKYATAAVGMDVDGDLIESCTIDTMALNAGVRDVPLKGKQAEAWALFLEMSGDTHEPVARGAFLTRAVQDGISEATARAVLAKMRRADKIREEGGKIIKEGK